MKNGKKSDEIRLQKRQRSKEKPWFWRKKRALPSLINQQDATPPFFSLDPYILYMRLISSGPVYQIRTYLRINTIVSTYIRGVTCLALPDAMFRIV